MGWDVREGRKGGRVGRKKRALGAGGRDGSDLTLAA